MKNWERILVSVYSRTDGACVWKTIANVWFGATACGERELDRTYTTARAAMRAMDREFPLKMKGGKRTKSRERE